MKKVVVMGGGTGTSAVLTGLREYDFEITALVAMSDSGGSSGVLRHAFGVLPPGDLRSCLVALSHDPLMRDLFGFRFDQLERAVGVRRHDPGRKALKVHSLGNLILVALVHAHKGIYVNGLLAAHDLLRVSRRHRVLPVTLDKATLTAEYVRGKPVAGEDKIGGKRNDKGMRLRRPKKSRKERGPIVKVFLDKECHVYEESATAIREADAVVIGPGDLYTSVLPTLLPKGVTAALQESRARKIYVPNLMTVSEETDGYTAGKFVEVVEDYLNRGVTRGNPKPKEKKREKKKEKEKVDHIVCNTSQPSPNVMAEYEKEGAFFVIYDDIKDDPRVRPGDFAQQGTFFRHDPERLARCLVEIIDRN